MKRSNRPSANFNASKPSEVHFKALADELFMSQFRGAKCAISGETISKALGIATAGHHILPKSVYPEYRYTKENICVLTPDLHSWAEDHPGVFMDALEAINPEQYAWVIAHKNHRLKVKINYEEEYQKLLNEKEST